MNQVVQKDELGHTGHDSGNRNELVYRDKRLEIFIDERLVAAYVRCDSQIMKWHEDAIRAHEAQPEVDLAQAFVHHPAGHLREPEISSGEDAEDCRYCHDHVEVAHNEVGGVQHDVNRRLCQEKSTDTAADKH